jgi:hypothetical protein
LLCPDVPGRRWPLAGVCPEYVQKFRSRRSNDRASLGRRHPAWLPGTKMAAEPLAADLGVRDRLRHGDRRLRQALHRVPVQPGREHRRPAGLPRLPTSRPPPGTAAACKPGYVCRDAWDGDGVCVTPRERDVAHRQNQEGPSRAVTSSQQYDLGGLSERARRVATRPRGQRHSQIRSCSA